MIGSSLIETALIGTALIGTSPLETSVLAGVLTLVRVSCFLAAVPLFGARTLPAIVKIGLALSLTVMWSLSMSIPAATLDPVVSGSWLGFGLLTISEVLVGVTLGMAFGIFNLPARVAGAYVAQEMGVNMSATADASHGQSATVMASLFEAIAILLFFALNMHYLLFRVLEISFQRLPVGTPVTRFPDLLVIDSFARIDQIGLSVVAPVVVCLLIGTIFLLLLNKASQSLNLFSLGLTLRILAGLFALLLLMPQICQGMEFSFVRGEEMIMDLLNSMFG